LVISPSRRLFWSLIAACALLAGLILVWLPAEKTIGQVIKIVYLHGALSRAGLVGLVGGGAAGLAYLLLRRPSLVRWSNALLLSGWSFWTAHFIVSLPATRLTWGPWIAWGEPRVTMTLQVVGAGLAILIISWLLSHPYFTAAAAMALGLTVLFLAGTTGVLRHPLDPISGSPSAELRLAYLFLLLPVIGAMALTAWRLSTIPSLQGDRASEEPLADGVEA
jgi:hypothetical protein